MFCDSMLNGCAVDVVRELTRSLKSIMEVSGAPCNEIEIEWRIIKPIQKTKKSTVEGVKGLSFKGVSIPRQAWKVPNKSTWCC